MTFRIGQKVVCVDDAPRTNGVCMARRGRVYTVAGFSHYYDSIYLVEQEAVSPNGFWADRFRPIVERKTDISIFTKMLKPSKVDA